MQARLEKAGLVVERPKSGRYTTLKGVDAGVFTNVGFTHQSTHSLHTVQPRL